MDSAAQDGESRRRMFAGIARRYDLNNRLHTLGLDQRWRKAPVAAVRVRRGEAALDAACGTGDLAGMLAAAGAGPVVGVDFCEEMLAIARRRFAGRGIEWRQADAQALPLGEASFDVVTIGFGLRNVEEPGRALSEFYRVLRRGGRLAVLEFHPESRRAAARLVRGFMRHVMRRTAGAIAGGGGWAYDYLCDSVESFMTAAELDARMAAAGFADVTCRELAFGVAAVHVGTKP